MSATRLTYFISVGLRGFTLVSKFIFIILLAHLIPAKDVGIFGLISTAVGYAIFAIGFEFYTFSTREIINSEKKEMPFFLKNQVLFYVISYFLFSPIIIAIFYYKILPEHTEYWFITLLFFEHASQEVNRILITIKKQSIASFILFIRQGVWCWVAIVIMFIFPAYRRFEMVFALWLLGTVTASLIGIIYIKTITKRSNRAYINWAWIKRGVYISIPMLLASLALRGVFTFDRFAIEHISGLEVLGAYTLFISMTAAIQSFIDTILISFSFPKMAELAYLKKYECYFIEVKKFAIKIIGLSLVLCIGCWICGYLLINWLDKPEYSKLYSIFGLLIIATFIYCLSLIPHLALYTLNKDKTIVISQIVVLGIFSLFLCAALFLSNIYIIPIGMVISFSFLLLWKSISFLNVVRKIKSEDYHAD